MTARRMIPEEKERTASAEERHSDKRRAILAAALELFTNAGYEKTTIADVARQAGVAVGTVYLYFKSKPELLYALKQSWEQELLAILDGSALRAVPPAERLRPIIAACFELCNRRSEIVRLLGLQPQEVGYLWQEGGAPIERWMQGFFEQGIAGGAFRPVDTRIAATLLYGMVKNAVEQCFLVDGGRDQAHYIEVLVDALRCWLLPGNATA